MRKNSLLLMAAAACLTGNAFAQQRCFTDENQQQLIKQHPELAQAQIDLDKQIEAALKHIDFSKLAKTTGPDQSGNKDYWYEIPVVVHIIHDYGNENLTDDVIFNAVKQWNIYFAKQNPDTANVVAPFKKWIGNPHIRLHLATKDPNGNPTIGITRRRSYLTYYGQDQAKFDLWPPTSYMNIWSIAKMGADKSGAAAYAQFPASAAGAPYYDGVISLSDYMAGTNGTTINHEIGHCFNLYHIWGNIAVATSCEGDDLVDDTPPTRGHNVTGCTTASLYDTICAVNYFKIYPKADGSGDSLVNYPDTSNAENIMDYTYCDKMFTIGQVERMHACLNNNTGGRSNLHDSANLRNTGVYDASYNFIPRPDMKPIPEFSCSKAVSVGYMERPTYFTFPGTNVTFFNETWQDTVTTLEWEFSNGATNPTSTSKTTVTNAFSTPGWASVKMKATGNHTGDSTREWPNAVFVADAVGTPAADIFQNFSPTGDLAKWPSFNYYGNEFKWEPGTQGKYDNTSLKYAGFDARFNPTTFQYPTTGTPYGDFDDFFSIPVDFSGFSAGRISLNFDYTGASRSSTSLDINDTFVIEYTVNKGVSWSRLGIMSKGGLCNKGVIPTAYTPSSPTDWAHKAIDIPAVALTPYTVFRFRYKPNVGQADLGGRRFSSGNNFYIDNIAFKPWAAAVGNVEMTNTNMAVVPNPTSGDAYVVIKDAANALVNVTVTDITGKVVYTTSQQINGTQDQVLIPRSAISVAGMYFVQARTGTSTNTQKLIVY